jgi:uncharacterized protein involved in cysteine biosynthesis
MPMLINAISNAIQTAGRPYFLKLLLICLVVTTAVFALFMTGIIYALSATALFTGWLEWAADLLLGGGSFVLAYLLFPAMLPLIGSMFQEEVASYMEKREYPDAVAPDQPFLPELLEGLKFSALVIVANILVIPFYFTVFLFPFIYYGMNGYLIGREFFETTAARHISRAEAKKLRGRFPGTVFIGGLFIMLMTSIPILNLLSPFIGVVMMTHLFHLKMRRKPEYKVI